MKLAQISTGFNDVPGATSLNLYFQGCAFHCPGCQNPGAAGFAGGFEMDPRGVIAELDARAGLAKWLCLLGGDFFFQAHEAANICEIVRRERPMVGIMAFTGALHEEVAGLEPGFEKTLDVLVDGRWMGIPVTDAKSNQRVFIAADGRLRLADWAELKRLVAAGKLPARPRA